MDQKFTRLGFVRSQVVPALLLFAIPAAGYAFAHHAQHSYDARFQAGLSEMLAADSEVTAERRSEIERFYLEHPPSELCNGDAEAQNMLGPSYVEGVCGAHQQFRWIEQASVGASALGVFSLLFIFACVGLSFVSREAQYRSFVAGWNFLRVASAVQVLAQGFIAVMLSFWVTAFFFESYYIKLILIVGVAALGAAFVLIRSIFRKPSDKLEVEGEPVGREQAPALWDRIEALCAKLGTEPPRTILGGIDNNFFVTEHPVHAGERVYEGRSLFVSLSLLKRLSKNEADAVLAHEMAHFSGGDTSFSKKLSPLLTRYVHYLEALYASALSRPVFYFMLLYFSLFQISLGRQRRERELRADKLAADATSADSIGNALLKVAAYSRYRQRVEQRMFDRNRAHSDLDIALSVAAGFMEYARGQQLANDLQEEGAVPHPFDSHPSLPERLANVGLSMSDEAMVDRVVNTESETWFSEIADAHRIESALWDAYESRFRNAHEVALAYRYLPANDAERAHVERFFPAVEIAGKEHALHVDCETIKYGAWENPLRWDEITNLEVKDKTFRGRTLIVSYNGLKSVDTTQLPLKKLTQPEAQVLEVVSRYYSRALTAKQHHLEQSAS